MDAVKSIFWNTSLRKDKATANFIKYLVFVKVLESGKILQHGIFALACHGSASEE